MTEKFVTLPREVLEQSLNALDAGVKISPNSVLHDRLRAALEQPQIEQEPVAWIENLVGALSYNPYHEASRKLPEGVRFDLYTRPQPSREPMTDEEILKAVRHLYHSDLPVGMGFSDDLDVARAIEAAHNIK